MNLEQSSPRALLVLGALLAPWSALAQSYTFSQSSGSFSSISGTGTPASFVTSTDDDTATISLPFSVTFYGSTYSSVFVSTNGILGFGSPTTEYTTTTLPSPGDPDNFIAGFWRDMTMPVGAVYYRSTGSAGSRVMTFEWSNAQIYQGTATISYQIRLYEAGPIEILYGPSSGSGSGGGVGIEDAFGSDAAGPFCGTSGGCSFSDLPNGTLLVFTPSSGPTMTADLEVTRVTLPGSVVAGGSYSIDVTVRNNGQATAGASTVQLAARVSGFDTPIGETSVGGLSGGQSTTVSVFVSVPSGLPSGSYPITALADVYGEVTESNESNNTFSAGSVTIGGGGNSINITTVSVPPGTEGSSYSFQLQQSGASSPTWSIDSGALPPGLSLSPSGRISGTPSSSGVYSFGVICEQSGLSPGTSSFSLEVTAGTGFRLIGGPLAQGTVGQAYTGRIEATGGTAPYAYQIVSGKPSWLSMAADGSLSGTPDATGQHELRVSVFDSATQFIEGVVMLEVVQGGPLSLVTTQAQLVGGVVGLPYTVTLEAAGGTQPYSFSVSNGSLPSGLSLDGDRISGTPSGGGMASFEIQVTDGAGGSASGQFTIEVTERSPLVIDVQDTITVRPEGEANVELRATGGVPPYGWQIVGGFLPAGLTLDGNVIRGTATSSRATSQVTLRVSDTQGESAEKAVTIEVRKATNNTGGGGGTTRRAGGCECVTPTSEGLGWGPLVLLLAGVGLVARRRRPFLGAVSVVEDEACPSRSSLAAPRSSRP